MKKYQLKLEDFVDNIVNNSTDDVNKLIKIAKRKNNKKRDFLFVNTKLGKHIPVKGKDVIKHFEELANYIDNNSKQNENTLIVGFSETATAIAQYIAIKENYKNLNPIYYLQTTRRTIKNNLQFISFEEEHSHAVEQKMYYNDDFVNIIENIDNILFIEDEITTGNTILNIVKKLQNTFPNLIKKYTVASVLNWQSKKDKEKFNKYNIKTLSLINGEIKKEIPKINILDKTIENNKYTFVNTNLKDSCFFSESEQILSIKNKKIEDNKVLTYVNINNIINGCSIDKLRKMLSIKEYNKHYIDKNNFNVILGTEEVMLPSILLSSKLNTYTHSTTKSPIIESDLENYCIKNSVKVNSIYDNSVNYLYNFKKNNTYFIFNPEVSDNIELTILANTLASKII